MPCSKSWGRDTRESREASGYPLMLAPVQRESHKKAGESSLQRTLWKLGQDLNNTWTSQKALCYLKIWRTKNLIRLVAQCSGSPDASEELYNLGWKATESHFTECILLRGWLLRTQHYTNSSNYTLSLSSKVSENLFFVIWMGFINGIYYCKWHIW